MKIVITYLLTILFVSAQLLAGDDLDKLKSYEGKLITHIEITGAKITKDYIISRELLTKVGQPFDLQLLKDDLQRLKNIDIFSSLKATATTDQEGVALTIRVREIPGIVPLITYEFTEEDGLSLGPSIKAVNLFGRDVFVNGLSLFGGKTQFLLNIINPWISGNHLSLDLTIALRERENTLDNFNETNFEVTPWIGTYWGKHGRAKATISYFRMESDSAGHTLALENIDNLVRVGAGIGYDSRDIWRYPHRGWLNEIEILKTGGFLPGDANFWTTNIDIQRYQPVTENQVLVFGSLLTLQTGSVGSGIPEYMDFHLGGVNSIRGYDITELGKKLFGKNQLLTTIEYRKILIEPREIILFGLSADLGLAGLLFTDTGIAWNKSKEFSINRSKTGYGFGIHLIVPAVDMNRFVIGFDGEGNWFFHFAAWPKFKAQRFRLR